MNNHKEVPQVQHPAIRGARRLKNVILKIACTSVALFVLAGVTAVFLGYDSLGTKAMLVAAIFFAVFAIPTLGVVAMEYIDRREKADEVEWDSYQRYVRQLENENQQQKRLTEKILASAGIDDESLI